MYVITYGKHPGDALTARAYPTRTDALIALQADPAAHRHLIVDDARDLAPETSKAVLTDIYSALTGEHRARFANRPLGLRLLRAALPEHLTPAIKRPRNLVDNSTSTDVNQDEEIKVAKYVKADSPLGKVCAAAMEPGATLDSVTAYSGEPDDRVIELLKRAEKTHGIGYTLGEDGSLALIVPEGASLFKTPKAKPAKKPRVVKLGKFEPVRANSILGKICVAALEVGATLDSVVAAADVVVDKVIAQLKRARIMHGIDYVLGDDGTISLVVPEGATLFKIAKAKIQRSSSPRKPREGLSKAQIMMDLVSRPEGASSPEILAALGWRSACRSFLGKTVIATGKTLRVEKGNGDTRYYVS